MRGLAILTTTAAFAFIGVASAQNAAAPTGAAAPAATPPPATAGNPVQQAVPAYAAYHAAVGDLRGQRVGNANELERALDTASRHNRNSLSRGWIAYGSMIASQSPAFMQGVRDTAAYYGRDTVIRGMTIDTAWARTLKGGDEASRLVLDSAASDAARIIAVADRYQELAYGLQRQRWANARAPQQAQRVQRVRGLGATPFAATAAPDARLYAAPLTVRPGSDPTAFGGRRFWDAVRGGAPTAELASAPISYNWRVKPERSEAINRMTTIAALNALNAAGDRPTQVDQLLSEQRSNECLEMAQLQLYQCMSAARFRYENAFCLGQHALRDVGKCISGIGQPAPTPGATPIPGGVVPAQRTN
jgi:hypothetical protein